MGKNKRARPLTQEEIWDDSALVQSWNDAVQEYKLYHSIHAKGENVEDVLRAAEAEEEAEAQAEAENAQDGKDEKDEKMTDADAEPVSAETPQIAQVTGGKAEASNQEPEEGATSWAGPAAAANMPNPLLSQVHDEGLKNLMMAWYYAGYYTGLHEGQQRANQNNKSS